MGLYEPTETDLRGVARVFDLHPLAVDDAVKAHQRPKVDVYGDSLFVVLRTLTYIDATSDVETGEISMFIGADMAITVRHGEGAELSGVRARMEKQPDILAHGPAAVLYAVADTIVDIYLDVAAELQIDVDELEASLLARAHRRLRADLQAEAGAAGVPPSRRASCGSSRGDRRAADAGHPRKRSAVLP